VSFWTVEVFWVVVSTLDTVAHVGSNSVKMHFLIFFVTENCVTGEYQCVIIRPISQVSFAQDPFCVGLLPRCYLEPNFSLFKDTCSDPPNSSSYRHWQTNTFFCLTKIGSPVLVLQARCCCCYRFLLPTPRHCK
jgi:hypothetical protein